jgi:MFS family permease
MIDGLLIVIGFILIIGVPAVFFLLIGDQWAKRSPTEHGDFFPTLHALAIVAAVVGAVLAWMAFATDHPRKWLHLSIPLVFVGIVYGWALGLSPAAWVLLARDIRDRIKGKHAV